MKLKTKKIALKRLKITGSGKILRRPVRQDHFNAKESGKKTRRKHGLKKAPLANQRKIKKWLPYL
jgi:ribosomal protein L35